ncbi:MAG: ParB/Srx family N-terminal domain-containing protein [Pseudomonadota bacterium]
MDRSLPLEVRYLPPSALVPDPHNERTHSKAQVNQLVRSIEAFGFTNPILVDEDNGIIAGHGRLCAAKQAGLNEVPTICLAGLSEGERKALRLADNKLALEAGWDTDLLKSELGKIAELQVDLDLTGFSIGEIDVSLSDAADPDDEVSPRSQKRRDQSSALSGRWGRTAFFAETASIGVCSNGSSMDRDALTLPSSTHLTTSRSKASRTARGDTKSLPWRPAR